MGFQGSPRREWRPPHTCRTSNRAPPRPAYPTVVHRGRRLELALSCLGHRRNGWEATVERAEQQVAHLAHHRPALANVAYQTRYVAHESEAPTA
jgi:hypothetical protein